MVEDVVAWGKPSSIGDVPAATSRARSQCSRPMGWNRGFFHFLHFVTFGRFPRFLKLRDTLALGRRVTFAASIE